MNIKKIILIIVTASAGFAGVTIIKNNIQNNNNNKSTVLPGDLDQDTEENFIGVEAQEVRCGVVKKRVKSPGVLKGVKDVIIRSEIAGKIKEIKFKEGTVVEKKQELILLEDDLYKANSAKAQAEYNMAKNTVDTAKKLLDNSAGTRKEYEDAVAKMNAAKASMEIANFELSRTVIRAPFSGLIGIMKETVGNVVQQHAELVSMVDASKIVVQFKVPVMHIEHIEVGQSVDVMVDSCKNMVFKGFVVAKDSTIDEKTNTINVKASINNKHNKLYHNMLATVILTIGTKSNAIIVNEDAIVKDSTNEYVWIIDKKTRMAQPKKIVTDSIEKDGVEVVSGLKAGDLVVTAGQAKLAPGAIVRILNTKKRKNNKNKPVKNNNYNANKMPNNGAIYEQNLNDEHETEE